MAGSSVKALEAITTADIFDLLQIEPRCKKHMLDFVSRIVNNREQVILYLKNFSVPLQSNAR